MTSLDPLPAVESATAAKPPRTPRRFWAEAVLGFFCVFGGLALPARGLGPYYVAAHVALGNALVEGVELQSRVRLSFEASPGSMVLISLTSVRFLRLPK